MTGIICQKELLPLRSENEIEPSPENEISVAFKLSDNYPTFHTSNYKSNSGCWDYLTELYCWACQVLKYFPRFSLHISGYHIISQPCVDLFWFSPVTTVEGFVNFKVTMISLHLKDLFVIVLVHFQYWKCLSTNKRFLRPFYNNL